MQGLRVFIGDEVAEAGAFHQVFGANCIKVLGMGKYGFWYLYKCQSSQKKAYGEINLL
ncbi:hypothetical protein DYBT9275_01406 [Dyadobacter sp. CECT 9275]|uniref:Uncharacterized protein n=1 Tax=Dyadobacter helix TaxID=2822344 RepID=A0A916N3D2_9BACT|nr:hypothetical protein DYBT9275_01406 [Dyadobacter sp. CECT 9275]